MSPGSSLVRLTITWLLCATCSWTAFAMSQRRCAVNEMSGFMNCSYRGVSRSIVLLSEKVTEIVVSIDFSDNKIAEIEQLHRYPNVVSLNFASNNISRIRNDTFVNVTKLEKLELTENKIRTIDPFVFSENKHLRTLFLGDNPLQFSESVPLLCSASLQVLDLRRCGIASLTKENLMSLPGLVSVDLSGNSLAALPPHAFSFTPSLTSLFVRDNAFRCDCDLVALVAWLRSKNTDLSLSDSTCVLTDENGTLREVRGKSPSNCNATGTPRALVATPEAQSRLSRNDSTGPEVEYIFISYDLDIRVPSEEEEDLAGDARIVSGGVYWAETAAPIVLLLLVVAAWVLIHRLFRTAQRVNDNTSISSADSIKGLLPMYKEDHTYAQVK